MNATTIEAYAMSKGIKQSYNEMDNATKVGLAMEMFLEKTSYAAGNYAKENKTFAGSFNTLKAATSNFLSGAGGIEEVADALISFGEILTENITELAPNVIEGLVTLTETLIPQIPILLQQLLPPILEGAISLINGLIAIFPALITMIQQNLPSVVQGVLLIIKTITTTLISMLPELLKMGVTLLIELVNGIVEALPELIPVMIDALLLMVETLLDNLDLLIIAAIDLIVALAFGLMEALPQLLIKIPDIITKIVEALTTPKMLAKLIAGALQLIIALAGGLVSAIPTLLASVPTLILELLNSLKTAITETDWLELGKNILNGILNGLIDFGTVVKDTVKKVGKKITKEIKSFFGIKSPSRLMRDEVGTYIADGIGVGFEEEIDSVYKDMQHALDLETGKMTANVQSSGTYQMAMAGTPTFNLVDNANNTTQLVVNGKVLAEVVNTENRNREVAIA